MTIKARQTKAGTWTVTGLPDYVIHALGDFAQDVGSGQAHVVWDPELYDPQPQRPRKAVRVGLIDFARCFPGNWDFEARWKPTKPFKQEK